MEYNIIHETAMIAAVMADHVLEKLYEMRGNGYVEAVGTIAGWAIEFEEKFRDTEDWDELVNNYTPLAWEQGVYAWDDIVMDYAEYKLQNV